MPLDPPVVYADAYLSQRVTQSREDQAIAEVAQLGTFPADWVSRLVVLRTYMITCTEMMTSADDTFAAKLAAYRKEFNDALPMARAAQQAADAAAGVAPKGGGSMFSVDLQRA